MCLGRELRVRVSTEESGWRRPTSVVRPLTTVGSGTVYKSPPASRRVPSLTDGGGTSRGGPLTGRSRDGRSVLASRGVGGVTGVSTVPSVRQDRVKKRLSRGG